MRDDIAAGDIYIARRQFDEAVLHDIRAYLEGVGRGSLPNYAPIEGGAPNFHRMNRNDSRAYVQGCFHQFVFFPWNQDPFDLFKVCAPVFHMKNKLSGLHAEKFLDNQPQDGYGAPGLPVNAPRRRVPGPSLPIQSTTSVDRSHHADVAKGDRFSHRGLFVQLA